MLYIDFVTLPVLQSAARWHESDVRAPRSYDLTQWKWVEYLSATVAILDIKFKMMQKRYSTELRRLFSVF